MTSFDISVCLLSAFFKAYMYIQIHTCHLIIEFVQFGILFDLALIILRKLSNLVKDLVRITD